MILAYDKDFCDSPMKPLASIPDGYKGSGSHEYNGEDTSPFGEYKRTPSSNAVPEVTEDGNAGPVSGEPLGKDGQR